MDTGGYWKRKLGRLRGERKPLSGWSEGALCEEEGLRLGPQQNFGQKKDRNRSRSLSFEVTPGLEPGNEAFEEPSLTNLGTSPM